jgi:hypothetical protein
VTVPDSENMLGAKDLKSAYLVLRIARQSRLTGGGGGAGAAGEGGRERDPVGRAAARGIEGINTARPPTP